MVLHWVVRKYHRKRQKLARNKASLISKMLIRLANTDYFGPRQRFAAALLHRLAPACRVLPLAAYEDQSRPVATLAAPADYLSEAPRLIGAAPKRLLGSVPAIHARLFSNARVACTSSAIVTRDRICIPGFYIGRPHTLITDGNFLMSQEKGFGVVNCPDAQDVPAGIVVFGSGTLNWYHWLIEILPAACLAEGLPAEFDAFPLLVPEACLNLKTFRDSLSLFAGSRKVVGVEAGKTLRVGQLVLIDGVASGPMNLRAGHWPTLSDYCQNAGVLRRYRAAILKRLSISETRPSRRIFLARDSGRRNYNQSDLLAIAERHGFEPVFPERMTFREQVAMYAEAEVLLGPSGAAFANVLFCQPGSRSLTWILPQYDEFCAYSNLANVVGMQLRYLFVTPLTEITSSFDAYSAAYSLDATKFERALEGLLDMA